MGRAQMHVHFISEIMLLAWVQLLLLTLMLMLLRLMLLLLMLMLLLVLLLLLGFTRRCVQTS